MQKTTDNISHYLSEGVPVAISADDFDLAALLAMAKIARGCETMLTISVSAETSRHDLDLVCSVASSFVSLDFRY